MSDERIRFRFLTFFIATRGRVLITYALPFITEFYQIEHNLKAW